MKPFISFLVASLLFTVSANAQDSTTFIRSFQGKFSGWGIYPNSATYNPTTKGFLVNYYIDGFTASNYNEAYHYDKFGIKTNNFYPGQTFGFTGNGGVRGMSFVNSDQLYVVGEDTAFQGTYPQSKAQLYDSSYQPLWNDASADNYIGLTPVSDSTFLALGGEGRSDSLLFINKDGSRIWAKPVEFITGTPRNFFAYLNFHSIQVSDTLCYLTYSVDQVDQRYYIRFNLDGNVLARRKLSPKWTRDVLVVGEHLIYTNENGDGIKSYDRFFGNPRGEFIFPDSLVQAQLVGLLKADDKSVYLQYYITDSRIMNGESYMHMVRLDMTKYRPEKMYDFPLFVYHSGVPSFFRGRMVLSKHDKGLFFAGSFGSFDDVAYIAKCDSLGKIAYNTIGKFVKILPKDSVFTPIDTSIKINNVADQHLQEKVHIYPIPSSDNIYLETPFDEGFSFYLYGITGELVFTDHSSNSKASVIVSNFPEGVYNLVIDFGQNRVFRKVVFH